jgi:HK97 family phage portal protein
LINRYRSWVYVFASRNGAACANIPLRLYATVEEAETMPRVRHSKPLSKHQVKNLIKQNPGRMTNRLRNASQVVEIFDHPFLELMARPNPWRSQFEMMEETIIFQDMTGDAYWNIGFDALGVPNSLNVLAPQYVRIVPDKNNFIKGYLYGRSSTDRQPIPESRIIHYRRPNPKDPYYGMGCLEACVVASNQYDSMDTYETALNKNMGIPAGLVSYKGRLNKTDIPALEADWNRTLRGMANSGKIKVTSEDYDFKQVSISPREMGFLQGRKWSRNEMANAFDMPISMIDTENVNKANAQAGNEQYARRAIMPRLRRVEDRLNRDLIPFYNEPRIFCAFDNPVPEDSELELKRTLELVKAGVITRNDARAMEGILPDPTRGDEYIQAGHPDSAMEQGDEVKSFLKMEESIRQMREQDVYSM